MGTSPPFWCQREWRAAADFSVTCSKRPASHWLLPKWEAPLSDDTAVSPNEVLAVPAMIADGIGQPVCNDMPMAAPGGAQVEQGDMAAPGGTEVLHVYSTGLNGSLPHDMPVEQSSATFHLRGAYGPSLSQMYADQGGQTLPEGHLPRAFLHSHAEHIEFCRCLLDDEGHQCWRDILDRHGQLTLPASVWPMAPLQY